ncbi:MAG: SDR family oxidoreductase [Gemmatimonadota bacterium]
MSEETSLEGRVVLVTGASAGIGAATARRLATRGASVGLTARRVDRLEALRSEIEATGGRAAVAGADAASLESVRAAVAEIERDLGPIDVLINNAGVMTIGSIVDNDVEAWTRMVDVNVKGVLHFVSATMPAMVERKSGHIVNVGSVAGRRPFPSGTVYSATKFAVRGISWGLHLELGSTHGIRVTDIQPGYVETELLSGDPETKSAWDASWEGRRTLQSDDVARTIEFALTAPDHVSVSELLVRPTDQPT